MKLQEKWYEQDGKIIQQKTFDPNPVLNMAAKMREKDDLASPVSDSKCIGIIPGWMWAEWAKEAGIKVSDTEAMKQVVKRKMLSGEFSKLRVWEGNY